MKYVTNKLFVGWCHRDHFIIVRCAFIRNLLYYFVPHTPPLYVKIKYVLRTNLFVEKSVLKFYYGICFKFK